MQICISSNQYTYLQCIAKLLLCTVFFNSKLLNSSSVTYMAVKNELMFGTILARNQEGDSIFSHMVLEGKAL